MTYQYYWYQRVKLRIWFKNPEAGLDAVPRRRAESDRSISGTWVAPRRRVRASRLVFLPASHPSHTQTLCRSPGKQHRSARNWEPQTLRSSVPASAEMWCGGGNRRTACLESTEALSSPLTALDTVCVILVSVRVHTLHANAVLIRTYPASFGLIRATHACSSLDVIDSAISFP